MIDFEVAKARQETARDLRGQAHFFLTKINKVGEITVKVINLKADLKGHEAYLQRIERILANPKPDMLPLRLDDILRIFPVEIRTND